eukprot:gene7961-13857_t
MDPSYEKYGKSVSKDLTESFNSNHVDSDVIHIHDIGHNIKNAEASLERGTHFDGKPVYDSSDIAVLMANLDGEHYQKLNSGISHLQGGSETLQQPAQPLSELIAKIRDLTKRDRLGITDRSMASQTAEAVYVALLCALRYIKDYFTYIGQGELIEKKQLKCLTTRLVECFFGHITENVQGNNIRYLEMSRHLTNDAFTFLLPYVNSKETGISVKSEKE